MVGAPRAARSRAAARVHSRRHSPDIISGSGAVCRKHLSPQTTAPLALCWQIAMFTAECCTASPLMHIIPAYALLADALVHHCGRSCTFLCTQLLAQLSWRTTGRALLGLSGIARQLHGLYSTNTATRYGGLQKNSVACELCICESGISTRSLRCARLVPSPFSTVALPVCTTLSRTARVVNLPIVRSTQVHQHIACSVDSPRFLQSNIIGIFPMFTLLVHRKQTCMLQLSAC